MEVYNSCRRDSPQDKVDDATYARLEQLANTKGFPVEQLQMMDQSCAE